MFHNRRLRNRINHLHERCLRIVYADEISSLKDLLEKDNSPTIHQRNLQILAIELFKNAKGLLNLTSKIFVQKIQDENKEVERRNVPKFKSRHIRTVFNGGNPFLA